MKKLKKLDLSGARILTNPQMKSISGGYGDEICTCLCYTGDNWDVYLGTASGAGTGTCGLACEREYGMPANGRCR